jgi:hypothetical protein
VRGDGSYESARQAMERLARHRVPFKINATVTRHNYSRNRRLGGAGATLRGGIAADPAAAHRTRREVWEDLRPTPTQNRGLYQWLLAHPDVPTGDSFFHLSAYGQPLEGLNLCGAGASSAALIRSARSTPVRSCWPRNFPLAMCASPAASPNLAQLIALFAHLRDWQVGGSCQHCNAYDQMSRRLHRRQAFHRTVAGCARSRLHL